MCLWEIDTFLGNEDEAIETLIDLNDLHCPIVRNAALIGDAHYWVTIPLDHVSFIATIVQARELTSFPVRSTAYIHVILFREQWPYMDPRSF